jgi:hypothetical protein
VGERAGYRLIAPDWDRAPAKKDSSVEVIRKGGGLNDLLEPPDGPPKTSPIYRMQWYLGDDPGTLQHATLALVNRLTGNAREQVGSGLGALRGDLKYDRLWPNFLITLGILNGSPYNSIHEDVNCDISDHGLFTLRVVEWKDWMWEWNDVKANWEEGSTKIHGNPIPLLRTVFTEKKGILEGGLRFEVSSSGFKEAFGIEYEGGEISAEP